MTSVAPLPAPPPRGVPPTDPLWDHRNEILLLGRVSAEPVTRPLPSGDILAVWRLAVRRPPGTARSGAARADAGRTGAARTRADAFTCVAFAPEVHDEVRAWRVGDVVEVTGALRRRFWRGERGKGSSIEVLVSRALRRGSPAAAA